VLENRFDDFMIRILKLKFGNPKYGNIEINAEAVASDNTVFKVRISISETRFHRMTLGTIATLISLERAKFLNAGFPASLSNK
jgi:hypothetical protein